MRSFDVRASLWGWARRLVRRALVSLQQTELLLGPLPNQPQQPKCAAGEVGRRTPPPSVPWDVSKPPLPRSNLQIPMPPTARYPTFGATVQLESLSRMQEGEVLLVGGVRLVAHRTDKQSPREQPPTQPRTLMLNVAGETIEVKPGYGPKRVYELLNQRPWDAFGFEEELRLKAKERGDGVQVHDLKCDTEHWVALAKGEKTYEVRLDDRGFRVGDWLWLREWYPHSKDYSGWSQVFRVSHVLWSFPGLKTGWVVMGLKRDVEQ